MPSIPSRKGTAPNAETASQDLGGGAGAPTGKAVYLWLTLGDLLEPVYPGDDRDQKSYFHKTDSQDVADGLCAMFQESEGEKLCFGSTPADELGTALAILADESIKRYRDGQVVGLDADFSLRAMRWEEELREKLGLCPNPFVPQDAAQPRHETTRTNETGTEPRWQEVQATLLRLCEAGEAYTSQRDLAKRVNCSESTINKALNRSPKLKGWMARHRKRSPKAQSLNDVAADNTPSPREADPADSLPNEEVDRAMALLIKQAEPHEQAELNALNDEGRREMARLYVQQQAEKYVEDEAPRGNRILGREP